MLYLLRLVYGELAQLNSSFHRDPRTCHLPLVGSPVPMFCVQALYVLFVKKWGPAMMANRRPMDVKLAMQIYNVTQVLLNLYVFVGTFWKFLLQPEYRFLCQGVDIQDTSTNTMNFRYAAYVFYISKYLDLLDTIFFVLRKKDRQISFLHVYHHTAMVYALWAYVTLLFGSHFTVIVGLNSFVHVIMYSYYFIAAMKPSVDLSPWKRVLTTMQLTQFYIITVHLLLPIIRNTCQLDMFWIWVGFIQNFFMIVLFSDFYIRTYMRKPRATKLTKNVLNIN